MYASPEATALVGIKWSNLRHSPFAAAIEAELSPGGALAFPDLDCLRQAREIVISSPALLAAEAGSFPASTVGEQAQQHGLRHTIYRGVTVWIPEHDDQLGVAQISDQLVLVGNRKTLHAAIDRGQIDKGRHYSPLPRAARFSQTGDLWAVAEKLPDPLTDLFVPLDADASEFLGQVSVRDGLSLEASFDAGSNAAAAEFARGFRNRAGFLPAVARGVEASADQSRVNIALQVSPEELAAALHPSVPQASSPAPVAIAAVEIAAAPLAVASLAPPEQLEEPVRFEVTHVEEVPKPQIVRIYNLDEGTREIVLQP